MDNDTEIYHPQRILVFQQKGSGENKIKGIRQYGGNRFLIETYDINFPVPDFIENGRDFFPEFIDADLVLDYLQHPDLSNDLWLLCEELSIPVVASNKKSTDRWAVTPRTCCALPEMENLGEYGKMFGVPEFKVKIIDGKVADISVLHSAPCGATYEAAKQTIGVRVEEAPAHIGLETQFFCKANPAGWDVMHGRSPVHFSAEIHSVALKNAINRSGFIR